MALEVKTFLNNQVTTLDNKSEIKYQGTLIAPKSPVKYKKKSQIYPIVVTAEDKAGNISRNNTRSISVANLLEFSFVAADAYGNELAFVDLEIDLDIGNTNDFEAVINVNTYAKNMFDFKSRLYIPETEFGGLIGDKEIITKNNEIILRGLTWRGLLTTKVIIPPENAANLILSGEINHVLRELIKNRFDDLFFVAGEDTQENVKNYVVERYTDVYSAIIKLLDMYNMRLNIRYDQEKKAVELKAVYIVDYSEELEYSQDNKVDFDIRDCRNGVNHLICGGSGQGTERDIIHLYVQKDGEIGDVQYYFGLEEYAQFYDYPNAESIEKLREDGIKRLKELQNYKKMEVSVNDIDLELGDIVGGREYMTNMVIKKPVVNKIFKQQKNGEISIEYKLKGEQ